MFDCVYNQYTEAFSNQSNKDINWRSSLAELEPRPE